MRILILALVLLMNIQPAAADVCDMQAGAQGSHHAAADDGDQDQCCPDDPEVPRQGCDHASHCGSCSAALYLTTPKPTAATTWAGSYGRDMAGGLLTPSHSSPPFRPPIS
jgi:hypothetical protein